MQFINAKQAYPVVFGITLTLLGMGIWQKFNQPVPEVATTLPVVVTQAPAPATSPNPIAKNQGFDPKLGKIGTLRVGNQTDHSVRIVLLLRSSIKGKNGAEPLNWDFAPGEGSNEGLQLSLPRDRVKVNKGDIIVAFATDGSRAYWGPNVVGETDALSWQRDRHEWNFVLK